MFRVQVVVFLQGRDGVMGLSRWLSLPFPPFPDLELAGITSEPDFPEVISSVSWDVAGEFFHVELQDLQEPEERLSELIESYGPGWELCESEPGVR
jgi:hypothetical protein